MIASIVVITGSAAPHAQAAAQSANCVASAPTLDDAKDAYAATCSAPRVDCDPIDGGWTCSSGVIGDAAPGGTTSGPTPPEEPSPEPTNPPADDTNVCSASAATLDGAKAAYASACTAPRVDCDPTDDEWTCSSANIADNGPSNPSNPADPIDPTPESTPQPTPTDPGPDGCSANASGQVDLKHDLISLHYDHAPDRDDGHATAAGKEVATTVGFTPWVIGGAYGADNANAYRDESEVVMDAVWGPGNWINANDDWNAAVQAGADRWQVTLQDCGDIWIAEGGQSDLSADIVRELKQRIPGLDTNTRIHLVQHSQWNEDQARNADLAYVKNNTDYLRIPDGNGGGNGTADFNDQNYDGPFISSALSGRNADGWRAAFDYYSPQTERLDFSDTVELMKILGIGTNEVNDIEEFADRFIRAGASDPAERTPTAGEPEPTTAPEGEPTSEPTPASTPEPTAVPGPANQPNGEVLRQTYAATDGPNDNPMKGWNSGWWGDRPESSVGFQYIKWSDLEPTNGDFDFNAVEDIIARPGSQDRHLILRLYCDWWGESATSDGCPDWIFSEVGVKRLRGDNGRYITDYNDPRFVDEAVQAIEALADRYDDDPRMYTFELGIIGYWGEWHAWGSQIDGSSYDITEETEQRILDAYLNSFDRVRVMARYPDRSIMADATQVGFHNDYFRPDNDHSAEFDDSVAAGARWLQGPIGGEIPPGLSSGDYDALYATPQGALMIDTGHYSTMKPGSDSDQHRDEHMALHRRFGYNYQIESASYSAAQTSNGTTNVALAVRNVGVAPFYYDWDVQFGLIDSDGSLVVSTDAAPYDLRTATPGTTFNLAGAIDLDGVASGEYELGVRIVQPGADDAKSAAWLLNARNTYVLFANDMPVVDGEWDTTNALTGGWSILGTTSVN